MPQRETPDLTASEERIARRVVALLRDDAPLLDASEVARRSGHSRGWVYEHAEELGAIRTGNGSRSRLRFPASCLDRLSAGSTSRRSVPERPAREPNLRPRRGKKAESDDFLPIRGVRP